MGEPRLLIKEELERILRNHVDVVDGEDALRDHIAALEQHVSDIEKSLENARKERDETAAELRRTDRETKQIVSRLVNERDETAARAGELAALSHDAVLMNAEAAAILSPTGMLPGSGLIADAKRVLEERDAALADNAALGEQIRSVLMSMFMRDGAFVVVAMRKEAWNALGYEPGDHPGAALLEELGTLRQRQTLWEEAATTLYGYAVFSGPCAHGRYPWDRCDECGEESSVHALVKVIAKEREEHSKALNAISDVLDAARRYSDKPHHLYSAIRRLAAVTGDSEAVREMDLAYPHHDAHRKALVRARNEGLERAAAIADEYAANARALRDRLETPVMRTTQDKVVDAAGDIAVFIRREKEPEQ